MEAWRSLVGQQSSTMGRLTCGVQDLRQRGPHFLQPLYYIMDNILSCSSHSLSGGRGECLLHKGTVSSHIFFFFSHFFCECHLDQPQCNREALKSSPLLHCRKHELKAEELATIRNSPQSDFPVSELPFRQSMNSSAGQWLIATYFSHSIFFISFCTG